MKRFVNLIIITIIISSNKLLSMEIEADFDRFSPELISSKGYPVETHYVETEDHYILAIHRIPNGNGYKGSTEKKPVVHLQHSWFGSSSDYIINSAKNSIGFLFFDLGYDVWMGNFRGNMYSRNHSKINPNDQKFWKFSFDEMSLIDLPTMVDYTLNKSGQEKLTLVGLSLGSATILAMLSEKPQYQKKIKAAALICPMSSLHYRPNMYFDINPFKDSIILLSVPTGTVGELLPNTAVYRTTLKLVCANPFTTWACLKFQNIFTKKDKYTNKSRIPVYLSHSPAGTSSYTATHAIQLNALEKPGFQKFDFGLDGNLKKYKQKFPPQYNLSKINQIKIGLFSSTGDQLVVQKDVDFIRHNIMANQIEIDLVIRDNEFTHNDFSASPYAKEIYYFKLFDFLKKFE